MVKPKVILSKATISLIDDARKLRPELEGEAIDQVIYMVFTEWLAKQGEQSVNEWIRESFF